MTPEEIQKMMAETAAKAIAAHAAMEAEKAAKARALEEEEAKNKKPPSIQDVFASKSQPSKPEIRDAALALLGFRAKAAFGMSAHGSKKVDANFVQVVEKAAGVLEGVFAQGGSLIPQTWSGETIEVLRDRSILLAAGARVESGYKGTLNIGRLNGGATAQFVAEGAAPTPSVVSTDSVILAAHKCVTLLEASNDMLRNPSFNSAVNIGQDMANALAVTVDYAGINGSGVQNNPLGLVSQVKAANKFAIAGASITQIIADLDKLITKVRQSKIPFQGNMPFFFMSAGTLQGLKSLRDNAGWVFRNALEGDAPTLNGYPVLWTDSIAADQIIGFGLAAQLYFGLETDQTIESSQPNFANDTTTFRGITKLDWKLRHDAAFSVATGVTY